MPETGDTKTAHRPFGPGADDGAVGRGREIGSGRPSGSPETKRAMRRGPIPSLLRFTRPYWWALPILVALGIAASLAEGVGIGLIIPALDLLLGDGPSRPAGPFAVLMQGVAGSIGTGNLLLVALGTLIVLLVALKTAILAVEALVATSINGRITRDLRVAICRQLLEVGMAFYARTDQGRLMNTLDTQTYRTSEALTALSLLMSNACTVLVFGVILLLLSWQMTLIALLSAAPVTLLVRWLSGRAHRYGQRFVSQHSALAGRMLEVLNGMRTIRLFSQEAAETRRFARDADRVRHAFVRSESLVRMLPALVELCYVPVFIAVLAYALAAGIGLSSLLVFLLLLYRLQNPLKIMDASRVTLSSYAAGIAEVDNLLDRADKPYLPSGSHRPAGPPREIRFARVGFRYDPAGPPAVRDVSFSIPGGGVCAIVGGSGAGKSTLVSLLCRFYDPCEGRVLVDGADLRGIDLRSWRRRLAFAGQDAELMSGTVAWNIAFGNPDADPGAVRRAAARAHAAEFIEALPEGYDTEVGARGLRLSGGQRQRIALARALLREPDVLILDEATNAVDSVTERAIQKVIDGLAGSMTIILIAHRLTSLRSADRVVVLDGGRVAEQGRPADLVRSGGVLARLCQAEAPISSPEGAAYGS